MRAPTIGAVQNAAGASIGPDVPRRSGLPLSPEYAVATVTNPASALTDFTLMIDLANLPASWWSAVDTSDGTKGRAAKDWDGEQLACDWVDFDDVAKTGLLRVKWSGSLASTGTQKIRVYPPRAVNDSHEAFDLYGQHQAYDDDWEQYLPLQGDAGDRTGSLNDGVLNSLAFGTDDATGAPLGGGLDLDGTGAGDAETGDFIYARSNAATWRALNDLTILAWCKAASQSQLDEDTIFSSWTHLGAVQGDILFRYDSQNNEIECASQGASAAQSSAESVTIEGAWHQLGMRIKDAGGAADEMGLYKDGAVVGTPQGTVADRSGATGTDYAAWGVSPHASPDGWLGGLSELQFHSASRSADWIAHEYSQTNDNATFWGTWDWAPDGIVYVPTSMRVLESRGFSTSPKTWADVAIGEAAADRIVVVFVSHTQTTATGVTIGGVAATQLAAPSTAVSAWYLAVAAGTEADVVLSVAGGPEYVACFAVAIYGGDTSEDNYQAQTFGYDADPRSFTTDPSIPTDGIGLVYIAASYAQLDFGSTAAKFKESEIKVANQVSATLAGHDTAGTWALSWTGANYNAGAGIAVGWAPAGGAPTAYSLVADAGAFALAGQDVDSLVSRLLGASAGSFVFAGQDSELIRSSKITAELGSFTLTGQGADLLLAKLLTGAAGTFALTGSAGDLLHGRRLEAEVGAFLLTGQDADLIYSPSSTLYVLTAQHGVFALNGQDADIRRARVLTASPGSLALAGQDASLLANRLLVAAAGSFAHSGQDADLLVSRVLSALHAVYSVSGQDADALRSFALVANEGVFVFDGQSAVLTYSEETVIPAPPSGLKLSLASGAGFSLGSNLVLTLKVR